MGADPVVESMTKGKAFVVLIASDFSKSSEKNILKTSQSLGVKTYKINRTKEDLSVAIGKLAGVVALTDRGFSDKIQELILKEQEQEEIVL